MKQRVATDERPFKTGSTDDSRTSDEEPAATLVVPPDGGWGWVVMVASFCCNFMVDGVIMASGASVLPAIKKEFNATESQVAPINSLLAGFYLLLGPAASALANKYGFRAVAILGSIISAIGFTVSYYATSPEYLYVTYGIIGGFGVCLIYMPAVLTVGFYFEKWRALATGIALCGSGVGVFVMSPITNSIVDQYGWRLAVLSQAGMMLLCIAFSLTFKPIEPVHVVVEETAAADEEERSKIAAEKLKDTMKLQSRLVSGIRMPSDMKFHTQTSPHTWMGVSNNTRYPTAEEVFRGSSTAINAQHRRSSATAGTIKSNLIKPHYATVTEKDEQEDATTTPEATEPLIGTPGSVLRLMTRQDFTHNRRRSSTADLVARPLYREDIFFGASLSRLPQYKSRTSIGYHMAVTHVPTLEDEKEETGKCRICPVAVRRALATLLDVSLFKSATFMILAVSGFFTMTGFFVPFMYVQNRATENKMPGQAVEWLVSSIGVANIVGRLVCGLVSSMPKVSPLWVTNIALTVGGLATMFSNFCFDTYFQYGYCVLFGLSVACFAALRSIVAVEYLGLERLTNCFGLFLLFQGLGALIGAPIAGMLYDASHSYAISFYVSGGFILLSALMCYPINRVYRWEKERESAKETAKSTSPQSIINKV